MKPLWFALALAASGSVLLAQNRRREVDDHARDREAWFYTQRAYPSGKIPPGARRKAILEIERLDRAAEAARRQAVITATPGAKSSLSPDAATWTLIGPQPTDQGSSYVTAGRVNAIAVDPRDSQTVYIGGAEGGVWKSRDGGVHWSPLTDQQTSLATGAVALDPSNPDIVYVGTGEENFAIDSYSGAGILKSTDGGATWTNILGPFERGFIGGLAVHPSKGQIVLCSAKSGIWRSADGGKTWTRVLMGIGTAVLFDPQNGNNAYAALGSPFGSPNNGVYKSTDAGLTWQNLRAGGSSGLPNTNVGRISLAIAPSAPSTLFAAIHDSATDGLLDIYKTTNGGAVWSPTNAPDICEFVTQCWYDLTIRIHPANPNVIFAGGSLKIIRSLDGGATWTSLSHLGPNGTEIHVDNHDLAFTPGGGTLYVANDGGIYLTSDVNNPLVSWTELNDTLAITQFYPGLSIPPSNVNRAYGGTQDNGAQLYSGSLNWNNMQICGDGGYTAVDGLAPLGAFTACVTGDLVDHSTDGGNNWLPIQYGIDPNDRAAFVPPMIVDPSNSQTLYFGTFRLWQSRDQGGKWSAISPDLTGGSKFTLKAIAAAPGDPDTVYAGSGDGKVQVTRNALAVSNVAWVDRSLGLPHRTVTSITVDPLDAATAYVTYSGFLGGPAQPNAHIFKTTNGGAQWTDISGNLPDLPVNCLVVDPDLPDTLYIGTDAGVLVSANGGTGWSTLGKGLPRVVVQSLVLHRASRTLRASTHGRSVWDLLVPLSSGSLQPSITILAPNTASAGGAAFTLKATGTNFGAGTRLRWNGQVRTTSVLDSTHLNAAISAADIAHVDVISVDVFNASNGAGTSNPVAFNIGPAPVGLAATSAASSRQGLAPGSIATLYGASLSGITSLADAGVPLPYTLGGTTMTIAGGPVALFFVSPLQVNFQVPFFSVFSPTFATLSISQGTFSSNLQVNLVPFAPAIFTANSQGTGQAAALIGSSSTLAAPNGAFPGSRPAARGETVALFTTGLGNVSNPPPPGFPAPSDNLALTLSQPTVSVGGVPAKVTFSGLAPGYVGLYQVNIEIAMNTPTGSAVPVVLSIGGVTSNTATIAVE